MAGVVIWRYLEVQVGRARQVNIDSGNQGNDIENGNNDSTLSTREVEKNCADLVHSPSKNARTHASLVNPATSQQAIAPPISMTKFQKLESEYRGPH